MTALLTPRFRSRPKLSLVRISHDHVGNSGSALGGVNTSETLQSDRDLASAC